MRQTRGAAVMHSYEDQTLGTNTEIKDMFRNLSTVQEELVAYGAKVAGKCISGTVMSMFSLINITQMIMGCYYLHQCPLEDRIPIYLIVAGTVSMSQIFFYLALPRVRRSYLSLVTLFSVAWLITGSVWIFQIYEPNYEESALDPEYCNKVLYLFAFWVTVAKYIMGTVITIYLCVLCALDVSPPEQ